MKQVLFLLLVAPALYGLNPHPRLSLDSSTLSLVRTKACRNVDGSLITPCTTDADWNNLKAAADVAKTNVPPTMTITAATNGSPVQFTITETVPFTSGRLYLGGGTGSWAGVNTLSNTYWNATQTGTHTFTIPVDSTTFGSFSGQTLGSFLQYGVTAGHFDYDYQGQGWQGTIPQLALVGKILNDSSYITPVVAWLDYVNQAGAAGINGMELDGWPSRTVMMTIGVM